MTLNPLKQILAEYDDDGVYVYQAFKPSIVASALEAGTFDKGFSLDRMTWIKPSFGWMLYRSSYATAHRQEGILKIKISHDGFLTILRDAIATSYNPDLHEERIQWQDALRHSKVRYQWDPDRDLRTRKLDRRAIQLGIRGEMVYRYVHEWIIGLEEATHLAHAIKDAIDARYDRLPSAPELQVYPVDDELQLTLGMLSKRH